MYEENCIFIFNISFCFSSFFSCFIFIYFYLTHSRYFGIECVLMINVCKIDGKTYLKSQFWLKKFQLINFQWFDGNIFFIIFLVNNCCSNKKKRFVLWVIWFFIHCISILNRLLCRIIKYTLFRHIQTKKIK